MSDQIQQSFTSSDGFEVTSSHETSQEIQKSLFGDAPEPEKAESASEAPEEPSDAPAEPADTAEQPAEAKPVGKNNKARHDPTERVKQALRQKKEAEEYAAYARKERDELAARAQAVQEELDRLKAGAAPKQAPKQSDGRPKSDDFDTWDEYTEALTSWKVEELRKAEREEQAKVRVEQAKTSVFKDFEKRMTERIQADPTIRERISDTVLQLRPLSVLREGERPSPLNLLAEQFLRSPVSAELMVYFSDNESELQRFSTLHPLRFGVELGKIEARFVADNPTAAAQVETSKAKPPVRPVTGGPATGDREPSDDASFDEYVKYHNVKERRR